MSARAQPSPMLPRAHAQAQASPRPRQPYSPRCPSPLGLPPTGPPPLAPHLAFTGYSYYPTTPDRPVQPKGPSESRVVFPPEARRPLAGAQRPRSQPPPPLSLNDPQHPPTQLPRTAHPNVGEHEMTQRRSQSPTPSETSSLSLYSAESVYKNFPVNATNHQQQRQEEEEKPPSLFCGCFSMSFIKTMWYTLVSNPDKLDFKALFGSKPKQNKIIAPPAPARAPAPQMVQTRRRPSPLNL